MDNRKIIYTSYLVVGILVWFLTRSLFQFLYLRFYVLHTLPGIQWGRELLPAILGLGSFIGLARSSQATPFLDEALSELRKVTWPNLDDVRKSTTVVIICILIASGILATFDMIWGKVIGFLLHG